MPSASNSIDSATLAGMVAAISKPIGSAAIAARSLKDAVVAR
jgi:hypothetical protein